jgi:hypothetical protein
MRMFLPNPRQTNLALLFAFGALFCAFAIRHFVTGSREVELACAAGLPEAVCFLRNAAIDFRDTQLFGGIALIAAACHLRRPDFRLFLIALTAAVFGLMLYNAALSAVAVGLLILSFARPVPLPKSMHERAAAPRTTGPASSRPPR